MSSATDHADVFISYSSADREKVFRIADALGSAGVGVWFDQRDIQGGTVYGEGIVRALKRCKVVVVAVSNAALRSRNVKQELLLAWKYGRPYLPLLLERTSYPEQVEFWLEGWQWVEVLDRRPAEWLPAVLIALAGDGVSSRPAAEGRTVSCAAGLAGLRAAAKLTDQIWPVAASDPVDRNVARRLRDLGAPQRGAVRRFALGSRLRIAIENDRTGHLLLLDEGPSGRTYCLCPSRFAPDTHVPAGVSYVPQHGAPYESFVLTGHPGREHLLAIVSDRPLDLDWAARESNVPARVLDPNDVQLLLETLDRKNAAEWTALSTYFDVTAE